jgi:hypothetical protein
MKIRPDPIAMIDLTRSLPTLQDSLTPRQTETSFLHDLGAAIVLGTIALAIILASLGYR